MSDSSLEWEAFLNIDLRGWETKKLGALFSQRKEKGHVNLPLLAITGEGGIVPRDSLERRDTSNSDKSKYLLIRKNDIAYNTMRMWQGVSGLSAYDGIASPAYTVCVANAGVSPNYAAHLFKFPQLIQVFHRNSQGMVDDTLNLKFENFSPIKVKIPLLPEQQKIAAILTSVDDVIESTQAQINKLKDLKTGMMQELLTKGIGHSAFKDSPVGTIPKAWEIFKIKDICLSIVDCVNKTAPVVDYPTPYKMIRTTNVRKGRVDTENVRYATQETFEQWTRRTPPQSGDLIFTREAPVGEVGILKKSDGVFLGQRTMLYRANEEKTNNVFLLYSMQSEYCQKQIQDFSGGSTVAHMRVPDCGEILIKVPPIAEQKLISDVLTGIEQSIETKELKEAKLIAKKKALMQDLLTGKVRVKVN